MKTVLVGMLDMLGADKKAHNVQALAAECMKDLDKSHDGKVTKGKQSFNLYSLEFYWYLINSTFILDEFVKGIYLLTQNDVVFR